MKNLITNARYTIHTLWVCIYPVLCTVLGVLIVARVPQGAEVVHTYMDLHGGVDTFDESIRNLFLALACLSWGLCSWYACRLLLKQQFPDEQPAPNTPFAIQWRIWFPRSLAGAGPLIVAFLLPGVGGTRAEILLRLMIGSVGLVAFWFVVYRRRGIRRLTGKREPENASIPAPARQSAGLPTSDHIALTLLLAFTIAIIIGVINGGYGFTRFLGAPTLLFSALAGITLLGSIVFVFVPKAYGGPSLALLPPIVFIAFAQFGWTDNHVLSDRLALRNPPTDWRKDLGKDFKEWVKDHPDGPIVLVAAEGGASRSGWWTAHVLGTLDQKTKGVFSKQVYAISGVSGGSLGAATYVSLLARRGEAKSTPGSFEARDDLGCEALDDSVPLTVQSACFLGRDFLSPVIGYMLYPDFLQRFLPWPQADWDRSYGLERSWQHDWRGTFGNTTFASPMSSLYSGTTDLPRLLLNTTMGSSGRLAIQSSVKLPPEGDSGVVDLFTRWPAGLGMPLATVVHNSARFPVVSPGGQIFEMREGNRRYVDVLMDGGYFENSGAAALLELVRGIQNDYKEEAEWERIRDRIVVMFITNDPPARDSKRDSDGCALTLPQLKAIRQEEILTPLLGLYSTRTARADAARLELMRFINNGAAEKRTAVTVSLDSESLSGFPPSMNWHLSAASRERMWLAADEPCVAARLAQVIAYLEPTKAVSPPKLPLTPGAFVQTRKENLR